MSRHPVPPDPGALDPLDDIEEILGACLAHPEEEWDDALARVCREHPGHATALRKRFAALQRAGLARAAGPDHDIELVRALAANEPDVAAALANAAGIDADRVPGMPPRSDARIGTRLSGRYRMIARIGAGAMGVVYRARDEDLQRDVAIKLLDAGRFDDAKAEARFLQEAELLAQLRHPAIVTLFDRGRSENGDLFLVMELLDGVPMTRALELAGARPSEVDARALPNMLGGAVLAEPTYVRQVVRWAAELADGLAAAHRLGILHRDIKPSNVFLCRDSRAVLLDFGIATRGGDLTAAGTILGTPWYMAPEQALAGGKLTPALDVYGLSSCLYHLLSGGPPFDGDPMAVLARIAREDPPRLSKVRPDLARDLHAIVETGMARALQDRYASADGLALDLRAFLDHKPVRARPLSAAGRFWRSAKRRPARVALGLAALVIVGLATGLGVAQARESARSNQARKAEIEARLPESLALEGDPEQRLLASVRPEHRAFLAELDELVRLDPNDLPPRLWRAALNLDEGEHAAAAADLAHVAQHAPTAYLRAVAQRYQRAARDTRGTKAIDLTNLGAEPSTPADCFVAGFHELRNRHIEGFAARAEAWLARAQDTYLPARDLRLLALLARADYEGDPALFRATIEESLRLEGKYGRATARTCAVRGAAQAALGANVEALASLHQSLELRPDRHGPLQNLAVAYRALGDLDKADAAIARAHALRPHFWNTTYLRAQILLDRREFARATEVASILPENGPGAAWKNPYLLANITIEELWTLRANPDAADARAELAERALVHLDVAFEHAAKDRARVDNRRRLVRALTSGDDDEACMRLLAQLSSDDDAFTMHFLAELLPAAGLSARSVDYLRFFLARLAQRKAPQDPAQARLVQAARARILGANRDSNTGDKKQ